jgi:hypothetical protein
MSSYWMLTQEQITSIDTLPIKGHNQTEMVTLAGVAIFIPS